MRKYPKRYLFIILNLLAITIYFVCILNSTIGGINSVMFSTVDAKSYLAVANWIKHNVATNALEFRPILYPILLVIFSKIGGVFGIFVFQSMLWLATINLIFNALLASIRNRIWAFIGGVVVISNFSLIALTRHALTEVATTFLLALLVAFCVRSRHLYKSLYFIHGCIFIMAMLAITKPVFSIPLSLLVLLLFCYAKKYLKNPVNFIYLLLVLMPVIIQMTIIKSEYGKFKISNVSSMAFNEYIYPQGIQYINKVSRKEALNISFSTSVNEKFKTISNHPYVFYNLFSNNLEDNIKASAPFLNTRNGFARSTFYEYMVVVNKLYYYLHLLFIPIIVFVLLFSWRRKKYQDLILLGGLYMLAFYFVIVTGISYWQGDRLVLPAIAIWSFLYPYTGFILLNILKEKFPFIDNKF